MSFKSIVTALLAQNATETTPTDHAEVTIPQGVKKIVGVALQISSAGITTLEDLTGILELVSNDMSGWTGTQQFLFGGVNTGVTSGVSALNPLVYATDINVNPGGHITPRVTFNKALTINPSTRVMIQYE